MRVECRRENDNPVDNVEIINETAAYNTSFKLRA